MIMRRGLHVLRTELPRDLPAGARLGGVDEIARMVGVTRAAVCNWRARQIMPEPLVELASGAVWDLDEVSTWNAKR